MLETPIYWLKEIITSLLPRTLILQRAYQRVNYRQCDGGPCIPYWTSMANALQLQVHTLITIVHVVAWQKFYLFIGTNRYWILLSLCGPQYMKRSFHLFTAHCHPSFITTLSSWLPEMCHAQLSP